MTDQLPPLPTSQMLVDVWDSEVKGMHGANQPYFTADQMRAYADAAVKAELESIATLVEQSTLRTRQTRAWGNAGAVEPCEIAAAIRARGDAP